MSHMMRLKNKLILFFLCVFASTVLVPPVIYAQASSDPDISEPHVMTGTDSQGKKCTSYWRWVVKHDHIREYTKVEWTSNPCGFTIQDQSQCYNFIYRTFRLATPSGKVKGVKVWARSSCDVYQERVDAGLKRVQKNGVWTPWSTYWPSF